jgi:5-methylthioadenosine/S-adenosylhomocysteine deaminase
VAGEAVRELTSKIDRCRPDETASLRIGVSPHAPYTVSEPLYRGTAAYAAANGLPMAVHIAESREETAFVRDGAGPFADALRARGIAVEARLAGPVAHLDRLGLLKPGTLLIHAVEIDGAELRRMRDAGAAVAHCPKSNAKFGHRVARVGEMRAFDIPVGLGTDSVASNNVVDMFEEMRSAVFHQRIASGRIDALDARAAFNMATIGGARALGLDKEIGSLEPGKRADFAVVDLGTLATQPVFDPIETMVYSASRSNIRATHLGGRAATGDDSELLRKAADIAAKFEFRHTPPASGGGEP